MTDQTTPVPLSGETVDALPRLIEVEVPANAFRCSCGEWWTGFTLHRKGGTCSTPTDLGMVPADRKYPAWAMPGSWSGPEVDA